MDAKLNGGPAFPTLAVLGDKALSDGGLTVRDYFAAHCPITIEEAVDIANGLEVPLDIERDLDGLLRLYADLRVRYADAMLAARASGEQPVQPAPNADGWIEWRGGECPVDADAVVDVRLRDDESGSAPAGEYDWLWRGEPDHADIVAYRVVGEPFKK